MGSLQGTFPGMMLMGSFIILMAIIMATKFSGNPAGWDFGKLLFTALFAVGGLSFLGGSTMKLLGWSKTRDEQFDEIAARAILFSSKGSVKEGQAEKAYEPEYRTQMEGEKQLPDQKTVPEVPVVKLELDLDEVESEKLPSTGRKSRS